MSVFKISDLQIWLKICPKNKNIFFFLQGFTDAIAGTPKVLVATGYDVDTDCGQLNIYRTRTDQIPQYLATLADNQTDR